MRGLARAQLAALVIASMAIDGCGATGEAGGGSSNLPVSGAGPFTPLPPADDLTYNAPFILQDDQADLDDSFVLTSGDLIGIWVTAKRSYGTRIEHADAFSLEQGFGPLGLALGADQGWEGGEVTSPALLWETQNLWIMFYGAGGMINWAIGTDGVHWTKAPGPALVADTLEEGHALGGPGVVHIDDRIRVYYPAEGKLWAAEAPYDDVAAARATNWTRLDGDTSTPKRDPFVDGAPFATSIGRTSARAELTWANRIRHDLYLTAIEPPTSMTQPTNCGFAASFTGSDFEVATTPILPPMVIARGCSESPYRTGALLFYIVHNGVRDVLAVATSPATSQ